MQIGKHLPCFVDSPLFPAWFKKYGRECGHMTQEEELRMYEYIGVVE